MLRVDLLGGDRAALLVDSMRDLYAEVYSEPPYCEGPEHVARFVDHFAEQVGRAGFSLAAAFDDAALVGAAYGWTMAAGQWFASATSEPPTEIERVPKFAIMEWMVCPPYRSRGVGRRLLDLVLAGRREPYAILASNPQSRARRLYDRLGWTRCGTSKPDLLPPMDVLAKPLTPAA